MPNAVPSQNLIHNLLSEDEVILETHTNKGRSVIVTNRRLFVVQPMQEEVESIDLVGDHIIGSDVTKEQGYKTNHTIFSIVLSIMTLIGWIVGFFDIVIVLMLLVAAFGVTVWAGFYEMTKIHVKTAEELHSIEIPADAKYIEQIVSEVISESSN